jgi:hypothetical protein
VCVCVCVCVCVGLLGLNLGPSFCCYIGSWGANTPHMYVGKEFIVY